MESGRKIGSGRDEVERAVGRLEELMWELGVDSESYEILTNADILDDHYDRYGSFAQEHFYAAQLNIIGLEGIYLEQLQGQLEDLVETLRPDKILTDADLGEDIPDGSYVELRYDVDAGTYVCDAQLKLLYRP
jgi:hypothetical protein